MSSALHAYKQWRNEERERIKKLRRELNKDEVEQMSIEVRSKVLSHPYLQEPKTIASYMSFSGEIDTVAINAALKKMQHNVCLPVVHESLKGIMDFYNYPHDDDLIANRFKILEPKTISEHYISPAQIEVVLVPLVGFNEKGDRLGMGGGYYDRMLKKISATCLTLGLAYDFQLVPEIKSEQWDMPLDEVITPTKHYVFNKKY